MSPRTTRRPASVVPSVSSPFAPLEATPGTTPKRPTASVLARQATRAAAAAPSKAREATRAAAATTSSATCGRSSPVEVEEVVAAEAALALALALALARTAAAPALPTCGR